MKQVNLTIKKATAIMGKDNKPEVKFVEEKQVHVVASTKSQNNLIEELSASGNIVFGVSAQDLYLDKAKTRKYIDDMVSEQINDTVIKQAVINQIYKGLDLACVFDKNSVIVK